MVSAVVVAACLVVLGLRYADTSGSTGDRLGEVWGAEAPGEDVEADARARGLVTSDARSFIVAVNTYGPADLDEQTKTLPGYVDKVKAMITPKFAVGFEQLVTYAEQAVAQRGLDRKATIYATGAESISESAATVLVSGVIDQTITDPENADERLEVEPEVFRVQVQLVRIEGEWLVDDFEAVLGDVPGEETPTPGATEAPTTTTPSSPVVQRYAEIVANRSGSIDDAVAVLDGCGFPRPATGREDECLAAVGALGAASRTLAASLTGAANPDSKVFAGQPPASIKPLVDATRATAQQTVKVADAFERQCVAGTSERCAVLRRTVVAAQATLIQAVTAWGDLS